MSTPNMLLVMQNIQTTLRAITTVGGYFNDVKSSSVVLDPRELQTVDPQSTPFTVIMGDPGEGTNDYSGSRPNQLKQDFTVRLRTRLDAPGTDPDRLTTAAWQWVADVEKSLTQDPQRGLGHTLYTYMQYPLIYLGLASESQVYVEIPVRITLNRNYGVP